MTCSITAKKLCNDDSCRICFNKSFISNEKSKFLNNKNINPRELLKGSNKKYDFKCDKCSHMFEASLNNINNNRWCPYCSNNKLCEDDTCKICLEKSFVSHKMALYWNYEKNNNINPRTIFKNSHKPYYFNCEKCEHIYHQQLDVVNKGIGCGYCCSPPKQLCDNEECKLCFEKSFESHEKSKFWNIEKNNGVKAREVFKSSNKKYYLDCETCNHSFNVKINNITSSNDQWCSYCGNKYLCEDNDCKICYEKSFISHYKSKFWCTKKNKLTPRQVFKNSHEAYWFSCDKCFNDFESRIDNINNGTFCPFCKNKTEKIVYEFLLENNFIIKKEAKFSWCKNEKTNCNLPFDFLLEDYKLIIEIDGMQHFENISHWNSDFKEIQIRDKYKMELATKNNFSIIRILQEDIYLNKYDWKEELLSYIKIYNNPEIIYICKNNEYECYN